MFLRKTRPNIRTHSVGSRVPSLFFLKKDSDKIKSALCLVYCHKPFFEAITVSIRCTKHVSRCELFQMIYHWAEVEKKVLFKLLFSIAPWLLVSLWHQRQKCWETAVNDAVWLYMEKPYRREPMLAWTKHQPSSSARIRVVSFTC